MRKRTYEPGTIETVRGIYSQAGTWHIEIKLGQDLREPTQIWFKTVQWL